MTATRHRTRIDPTDPEKINDRAGGSGGRAGGSTLQARMTNPAYVLPTAIRGIGTLFPAIRDPRSAIRDPRSAIGESGLAQDLAEIVALRTCQTDGFGACVHGERVNTTIREPAGTTWG
ncbi:hypothetical protein ACWCQK_35900 [Streptomyces sp. NPDC002306]